VEEKTIGQNNLKFRARCKKKPYSFGDYYLMLGASKIISKGSRPLLASRYAHDMHRPKL